MSKTNFFADPNNQPKKIKVDAAIELLSNGHTLQKPGKDLDTLTKKGVEYHYKGLYDQGVTVLDEKQVSELIKEHNWIVDPF